MSSTNVASRTLCVALPVVLLISFQADLQAQRQPDIHATLAERTSPPPRNDTNKSAFNQSNQDGWDWVEAKCTDTSSETCAHETGWF